MVQFNFSERTIKAKVVYYGPAQSGKTTNLEQIHRLTDPGGVNSLISLNTGQDRTLFFDLLPFSLGTVSGYDFKVQLYTVPGQVQYNATRRVVLAGADAVVFVADSRKTMAKDNVTAFENMKVNLLANRLVPEKVPLVLQYNKRDLPDLQTEAEMGKALNPWSRPAFPSVAAAGQGVLETFSAVVQEMLAAIAVKYNLKEKGLDPAAVPELVAASFANLMKTAGGAAPPTEAPPEGGGGAAAAAPPLASPAKIVVSQSPAPSQGASLQASPETGLVSEELLHRAIRSNVELAEALSSLVQQVNTGLGTILSHAELLGVYREDAREKRAAAIQSIQEEAGRLREIMKTLGDAGAAASGSTSSSGIRAGVGSSVRPRPAPAVRSASPASASPASLPGGLLSHVEEVLGAVRDELTARAFVVETRIPPDLAAPRCEPANLKRILTSLLDGISGLSHGSTASLRSERKPVLLRGRDGSEIRKEFVMVAVSHPAVLSPAEQQQVVQGLRPGALGDACRGVRELGGFVRFAPLAGGALETRLFFPA